MINLKELSTSNLLAAHAAAVRVVAELDIQSTHIRCLLGPKGKASGESAEKYRGLVSEIKQEIESRG